MKETHLYKLKKAEANLNEAVATSQQGRLHRRSRTIHERADQLKKKRATLKKMVKALADKKLAEKKIAEA